MLLEAEQEKYRIEKYKCSIRKENMDAIVSDITKTLDKNLTEEEKFLGFIKEVLDLYLDHIRL